MKTVKLSLAALAIAGLSLSLATGAHAQGGAAGSSDLTKVVKPFSVKVGGLFFTDSDTKDAIGTSTLSVGLGYDFLKTKTQSPIVVGAYVDYFASKSKDQTLTVGGTTTTVTTKLDYAFGVGVQGRYVFINDVKSQVMPYAFAGLGVYTEKIKADGSVNLGEGSSPISESKTKTGVGGKIGVGVEFKQGFLGEIEYNFLPEIKEDNAKAKLSGFGVRVGYRF